MKALLVSAAAIGLFAATPAFAQAGPTSTANANADAEIVTPIAVVNVAGSNLSFGRLAAYSTDATVSVDASGVLSPSNPGMVIAGSSGNAAEFNVTGAANLAYTAAIDPTVTLTGVGSPMTASLSKSGGAATLSGAGTDSFKVIGTLTVNGGQAAGSYTGQFGVSVQYN